MKAKEGKCGTDLGVRKGELNRTDEGKVRKEKKDREMKGKEGRKRLER